MAITFAAWLVSRIAPDGALREFADQAWRIQAVAMATIFALAGFLLVVFG
ncbi:hypothetical protein [Nocardia wallacei]|nr:hypothetical protein [Nocardia wallacei]